MAKKRQMKREPMPDWIYNYITKGEVPDNTGLKSYEQKPGTWNCFNWSKGDDFCRTFTSTQPLSEVKEYYKEEIAARLKAEKKLLKLQ